MTAHHFTFQITDESDASDIREVETRAFGFSKEADLTASLLEDESARPALSLLARHEGKAVGHILFTGQPSKGNGFTADAYPRSHGSHTGIPGMGVGGRLIRTGIEHLRLMGCQTVLFSATPPITPDMGSNPVPETKAIRHLIPSRRSTKPAG